MNNVYDRTAEVLHEQGWNQGGYMASDGSVCLIGALRMALGTPARLGIDAERQGEFQSAILAIQRKIDPGCVANWNDSPGRTFDEVLHLLKELSEDHELAKEKR